MATDLTGGLGDDREYVFATQPDDPEMRESVNAWIWDDGVEVGMPRIGIEAVADQWDTHDIQLQIAYADGRTYRLFGPGKVHDALGADGTARTLGAGPLSFELVEPYTHWKMHFEGLTTPSTTAEQIAGTAARDVEPSVPVEIEIDLVAAVPPWEQGALLPEAGRVLAEQDEGALMGGPRFEQLNRATGVLRVADAEHRIDGGALRIRRAGVRRLGTFRGHAWQSSVFPSGRAFGLMVYPPRDDGLNTYNEGFVFEGDGELVPAWVVDAPWLRKLQPSGEDVSVVIETANGTEEIQAETVASCFSVMGSVGSNPDWPVLQQAIVRYSWRGETANGMMERSTRGGQIEQS
jgi:hypothetical protein